MPRRPRSVVVEEGKGGEEEEEEEEEEGGGGRGQSFRADRRLARLVIARYWADRFYSMFLKSLDKKEEEVKVGEEEKVEESKEGGLFMPPALSNLDKLKL